MTCPQCHRRCEVTRRRLTELDSENRLFEINSAELSCGCTVPLARLCDEDPEGWVESVRRQVDDNLRRVFG